MSQESAKVVQHRLRSATAEMRSAADTLDDLSISSLLSVDRRRGMADTSAMLRAAALEIERASREVIG